MDASTRTRLVLLALAALGPSLVLTACPNDGGACDCIPSQSSGDPELPSCGALACETASATRDPNLAPINPDAVTCALEALRDRTPGYIVWQISESDGQFTDEGYILIHDDGTAVRRTYGAEDLAFGVDAAQHGELEDAAIYEACLAETDDAARFTCMTRALASVSETCASGWLDESV